MYRLEARKIAEDDDGHWITVQVKTTHCSYIVTLKPYDQTVKIVGPGVNTILPLPVDPESIMTSSEQHAIKEVLSWEMEE